MTDKELQKLLLSTNTPKLKKILCGKLIGSGIHRKVYSLKQNPDYVVKVEQNPKSLSFANVTEYLNYINNRQWIWFTKYLAPCIAISTNGELLIQIKATQKPKDKYPKQIPAMFTDIKYQNFGWINNQFVCLDYSFIPFYTIQIGKSKTKPAKWQ